MWTMSFVKNGSDAPRESGDKDLDGILNSPACRKLFTWAMAKDANESAVEKEDEIKEEQRLRWNFDFETETPLPGRYHWMRTDFSNGHHKNGDAARRKIRNDEAAQRSTHSKFSTPYSRKSRTPQPDKQPGTSPGSAGSCDSMLNESPRRSERKSSHVQLKSTHCRFKWD